MGWLAGLVGLVWLAGLGWPGLVGELAGLGNWLGWLRSRTHQSRKSNRFHETVNKKHVARCETMFLKVLGKLLKWDSVSDWFSGSSKLILKTRTCESYVLEGLCFTMV